MTKQHRFTMYQNTIYDDGNIIIPFECMKLLNKLNDENEQLKQQLFEARKDYLIETADISDKLYLDDEIEKERREIFGDVE